MARRPLEIVSVSHSSQLEECCPSLMPFHIEYSGPAPISTYLRVERAKDAIGAPHIPLTAESRNANADATQTDANEMDCTQDCAEDPSGSGSNENDASQSTLIDSDATETRSTSKDTVTNPSGPFPSSSSALSVNPVTQTDAPRFASTFRGRSIHGLKVQLPEGYTGLVFRGQPNGNSSNQSPSNAAVARVDAERMRQLEKDRAKKSKAKKKAAESAKRTTRRSKRVIDVDADDDGSDHREEAVSGSWDDPVAALVDEEDDLGDDAIPRIFVPSTKFSSFLIWHPDLPVNEGKDEYYRSLFEWTRLAHEIHKMEE